MKKSKPILLVSTKAGSGKSVIAIGMFLKFKEEGLNPGYFKSIGDAMDLRPKTKTDKDVNVITAVVARQFSKEEMCPQFLNPSFSETVTSIRPSAMVGTMRGFSPLRTFNTSSLLIIFVTG